MELVPDTVVAGVHVLSTSNEKVVTRDRINRIWAELSPRVGLTTLQMAPSQDAANFVGSTAEEGVTIQDGLVQVRWKIRGTVEESHRQIHDILKTVVQNLGEGQLANFGIRHVLRAPLPTNDARDFILNRVLSHGGEAIQELTDSADTWGGVKYVMTRQVEPSQFTLVIEPLQADDMRSLYIDLDAQFPGLTSIDTFLARAEDAKRFLDGPVNRYLDQLVAG